MVYTFSKDDDYKYAYSWGHKDGFCIGWFCGILVGTIFGYIVGSNEYPKN